MDTVNSSGTPYRDFCLNDTARIWPCPFYMYRIRLKAVLHKELEEHGILVLIADAVSFFEVRA